MKAASVKIPLGFYRAKADELVFISRINRDGLSVGVCKHTVHIKEEFKLFPLSVSERTYIAHGFNSYVVRLKKGPE